LPYKFTSFSIIITQAVRVCDGNQNNVIRIFIEWCHVGVHYLHKVLQEWQSSCGSPPCHPCMCSYL